MDELTIHEQCIVYFMSRIILAVFLNVDTGRLLKVHKTIQRRP